VTLDDVAGLVLHALDTPSVAGACNVVAPGAVTSAGFARALGRALRRPALLPVPAFALRLAFGEMADEVMLASTRAQPRRALESGYGFLQPQLGAALAHVLGSAA
jgi:NAD dependent epimerase/dehydratase family enzyme